MKKLVVCVMVLVLFGAYFINTNKSTYGANGSYCDENECFVAIYDNVPGKGEIVLYYQVPAGELVEEDLDEYFYMSEYSKEELASFGYDVSEGSNEAILYEYTGKYIAGYYYYPEYY